MPDTKQKLLRYIKLFAVVIALAVAVQVPLFTVAFRDAVALVKQQINDQQVLIASQTSTGIEKNLALLVRELELLAATPALQDQDTKAMRQVLTGTFAYVKAMHVNDIGVLDAQGILKLNVAAREIVGRDFSFRAYFQSARRMKAMAPAYEMITFQGADRGGKGIAIAMPILRDADFRGVVLFTVKADELIEGFMPHDASVSMACVIDQAGGVLYHPVYPQGTILGRLPGLHASFQDFLKTIRTGGTFRGEYITPQGVRVLAGSHGIEFADQKWTMVVATPEKNIQNVLMPFTATYFAGNAVTVLIILSFVVVMTIMVFRWNEALEKAIDSKTGELTKSEQKLKTLVETINDWIWEVDSQGRYVYVSPRVKDILGYAPEEMIGKAWFSFLPGEEARRLEIIFREKAGKREAFFNLEYAGRHKNGMTVTLEASATPILEDNGNLVGYRGANRDISERKAVEKEREAARQLLQRTIDGVSDPILVIGLDHEVKLANRALREDYFNDSQGAAARKCYRISHGRETPCTGEGEACPLELITRAPVPVRLLHEHYKKSGEKRFIEVLASPLFSDSNELIGIIEASRDITEQKKLEEELYKARKLESLGVLAGGIAHDFNNLLTAFLGNISLAKLFAEPGSEIFDALTGAEKASRRAQDLTHQLLTFSKGGMPIKETASIAVLIKDSTDFTLRGSNVKAVYSMAEDLWPVEIDQGQISQVVQNLITNADQAMPEGGIVHLRAKNVTVGERDGLPILPGKYIKIEIEDMGCGIPDDDLDRIFDPYFTTKQKGSGLGLATCYSIIRNHGGLITADSKPGAGTTFSVYLPVSEKKTVEKMEASEELQRGEGCILVLDDEEEVRTILDKMLARLGYEADFATDGSELLALYTAGIAAGKNIQAVILDLTIPGGMGGEKTMAKLLEIDPYVKAVVSSGYARNPVMADFERYGFRGVVPKPYRIQDLSNVLHQVIQGRSLPKT